MAGGDLRPAAPADSLRVRTRHPGPFPARILLPSDREEHEMKTVLKVKNRNTAGRIFRPAVCFSGELYYQVQQ